MKHTEDSLNNDTNKKQQDIDNTQNQIDQTLQDINKVSLDYFEFLHSDNPYQMLEDAKCEIAGDSIVCWVSNLMPNKVLIPRFSYQGKSLTINGKAVESGVTAIDFAKPLKLTISSDKQSKDYTIYVYSYTGIPVLWLTTNRRENISVSEKIYQATLKLMENARTRASGDVTEANVRLSAIGPVSLYYSGDKQLMGKNNYRFSFSSKFSILSEPANTTWELLSNASDPTMLHTQAGFHMGKISNLHYTPRFHFADLMLNMCYYGVYMLGETIDYSVDRTDVGLDGFIVKIDGSTGSANFRVEHLEKPVTVVYPTVTNKEESFRVISDYIRSADTALFGSYFTNTDLGWQKYMDMDSFVDWYLINEITGNQDGAFSADCYMNMKRDGKLRMGPLWKMERSFGYDEASTSGFVVKNTKWFNRLFQDPAFVEKVKERFIYFYNHKNDIFKEIDADTYYLRNAIPENNNKWKVFVSSSDDDVRKTYQIEVKAMKSWFEERLEWLKGEFDKM